MKNDTNNDPPRLALVFFRWFCNPSFREEIEGDLLERFSKRTEYFGLTKARQLFIRDVLLLFRPSIIKNISHLFFIKYDAMKNILALLAAVMLIIAMILSPFMPGPSNLLVIGFSSVSLALGFFGLLFIPIGIMWTATEWMKVRQLNNKPVNGKPAFYFSIATTILAACISLLYIPFAWRFLGASWGILLLVLEAVVAYKVITIIVRMKNNQWKDGAALEEIVIYDKNPPVYYDAASFDYNLDRYRIKGAFAGYDAGVLHWQYYLCD